MPGFDTDVGWVSFPLLSPAEIAQIIDACMGLMAAPADVDLNDKPAAGTRHLRKIDQRVETVTTVLQRDILTETVAEIIGPSPQLQQAEFRCPQPGFGEQRLHADSLPQPTADASAHVATAIVALVDFTTTNGATRVLPGSHRRPDLQRQSGQLQRHADEQVLTGPAGTAFVFSGHLLHAGGANRSAAERPALQLVWHRG